MRYFFAVFLIVGLTIGAVLAQDTDNSRRFHLGFTPFPYEVSLDGITFAYDAFKTDADIVAHHFDNGIPWNEALAGEPYSSNIMRDWEARRNQTPDDALVYLAITPISIARNSLAPYRGEADDMPLPAPWDSYSFNHPDVKQAYLNYAIEAVAFFQPDYLAIGIEVNLLYNKNPAEWEAFMELYRETYTALKARYPELPIFASVLGVAFLDGYRDEDDPVANRELLVDILEYSDFYAISLYPYLTRYLANQVPETMWDDLFSLSDKPIAITETGYPAQAFSVFNGTISVDGTPEKQNAYISRLLQEANDRNFEFVINFIVRDYDALYEWINGGDLELLWRDTGLYDEDGNSRPALDTWRAWLARPYENGDE